LMLYPSKTGNAIGVHRKGSAQGKWHESRSQSAPFVVRSAVTNRRVSIFDDLISSGLAVTRTGDISGSFSETHRLWGQLLRAKAVTRPKEYQEHAFLKPAWSIMKAIIGSRRDVLCPNQDSHFQTHTGRIVRSSARVVCEDAAGYTRCWGSAHMSKANHK
jgi:hypothetical protein